MKSDMIMTMMMMMMMMMMTTTTMMMMMMMTTMMTMKMKMNIFNVFDSGCCLKKILY